ncbi:MAG TPA: ABC transporter ATP-binding protein [Actinomycetota bacterium]|nr:ABC transporter ATP-binding protein [Actinomycetota bacterium]
MANVIEAVGLSKRFRIHRERRTSFKERFVRGKADRAPEYFWALKDVDFVVPRGASLGLIGHNGSGKSTALKVLAGIYQPTSGTVTVNGWVSALLEVGAGFHPELTGRENIRLNATILGFTRKQIDALMDEIIEFADIGDFIESPVKHYSSGMYVRLGFAVAVMVRPEILIVDEVIAVGDEEFQRKCFDYLHGLRRSGTSMLIVSHGLGSITDLCDEALWLDHGEARALGPSQDVTQAYLDEVNAKEAAKSVRAVDPGVFAAPAPGRRGSGQVRFLALETINGDGESVSVLISGAAARLRIHYECHTEITDVVFQLNLHSTTGTQILALSSMAGGKLHLRPGRGYVDFVTDDLLLLGGTYNVEGTITTEGVLVDASPEGSELTIRAAEVQTGGTYLQRGKWLHLPLTGEVNPAEGVGR